MKNRRTLFTFLSVVLFFSACKSSTSPSNTTTTTTGGGGLTGSFTATIDGQPWQSAQDSHAANAPWFYGDYDSTEMQLLISSLIPYGDTGVHQFGVIDSLINMSFEVGTTYYDDVPKSGTIDLNIYTTNHIKATYNFTGKDPVTGDTITVANGKVDYSY